MFLYLVDGPAYQAQTIWKSRVNQVKFSTTTTTLRKIYRSSLSLDRLLELASSIITRLDLRIAILS
jgi:hypothetical protein